MNSLVMNHSLSHLSLHLTEFIYFVFFPLFPLYKHKALGKYYIFPLATLINIRNTESQIYCLEHRLAMKEFHGTKAKCTRNERCVHEQETDKSRSCLKSVSLPTASDVLIAHQIIFNIMLKYMMKTKKYFLKYTLFSILSAEAHCPHKFEYNLEHL